MCPGETEILSSTEEGCLKLQRRTKDTRNTRELYSNDLRVVGPRHAQLKTK